MMCKPCFYNGNRYEFVQSLRLDLENAQRMCQKNGGSLAKHLDERVAKNLNKCCQNGGQYRIGLIADEVCNGATPFRWIGEYSCRDSSPWKNINPWFKCQTISISLLYYIEGRLPDALLEECETNTNYICQYSLQITTPVVTTATTSPTPKFTTMTTTGASQTTTETVILTTTQNLTASTTTKVDTPINEASNLFTSATITTSKSSTCQSTIATTPTITSPISTSAALLTSSADLEQTQFGPGAIAGVVVGLIIGMAMLLIGIYFYKKKKQLNKSSKVMEMNNSGFARKHSISSNKFKETVENPIYLK